MILQPIKPRIIFTVWREPSRIWSWHSAVPQYVVSRPRRQKWSRTYASQRHREIFYAFDPASTAPALTRPNHFSFLAPTAGSRHGEFQNVNSIHPTALGVPWPTSFPGALESKYWVHAEEVARQFAHTVLKSDSVQYNNEKYIEAVVDAAVSFAVHVSPMGDETRMSILAKAYVLIFIHDDAVDSGNLKATIPTAGQTAAENSASTHQGYHMIAKDVLSQGPPALGYRLLDGILSWAIQTIKTRPGKFSSLEDYMSHRVEDVGAYPIFRTVEYACGVFLSPADMRALDKLSLLCAKHFLLTNDLYSYPKEASAEQERGEPVFNAVRVIQDLMGVTVPAATAILRHVIWDVELSMQKEYKSLVEAESGQSQLVIARGLIAAIAGNMFFSATCARYARAVPGSKLK